jgi:hypothetical protein
VKQSLTRWHQQAIDCFVALLLAMTSEINDNSLLLYTLDGKVACR